MPVVGRVRVRLSGLTGILSCFALRCSPLKGGQRLTRRFAQGSCAIADGGHRPPRMARPAPAAMMALLLRTRTPDDERPLPPTPPARLRALPKAEVHIPRRLLRPGTARRVGAPSGAWRCRGRASGCCSSRGSPTSCTSRLGLRPRRHARAPRRTRHSTSRRLASGAGYADVIFNRRTGRPGTAAPRDDRGHSRRTLPPPSRRPGAGRPVRQPRSARSRLHRGGAGRRPRGLAPSASWRSRSTATRAAAGHRSALCRLFARAGKAA